MDNNFSVLIGAATAVLAFVLAVFYIIDGGTLAVATGVMWLLIGIMQSLIVLNKHNKA